VAGGGRPARNHTNTPRLTAHAILALLALLGAVRHHRAVTP
jgi:hypothetical protein